MTKERLPSSRTKSISPSEEFLLYIRNAWQDNNEAMPTYGKGGTGIFDYYGRNNKGVEQARFRIPWGDHGEIEKSYHISRSKNGEFVVTDEGFYPHTK